MNRIRAARENRAAEPRFLALIYFAGILCALSPSTAGRADIPGRREAEFASHTGNLLFLAAGAGLPLLEDGRDGKRHALRAADALGASVLISESLKYLVREKRPGSTARDSFPSGHATAAFAVATAQSAFHPRQAPVWFLGATLIAESRVRLHRHYTRDVLAGAALGYLTARWELSRPRGLILAPVIPPGRGGIALRIHKRF